jgi:hypothetical protein
LPFSFLLFFYTSIYLSFSAFLLFVIVPRKKVICLRKSRDEGGAGQTCLRRGLYCTPSAPCTADSAGFRTPPAPPAVRRSHQPSRALAHAAAHRSWSVRLQSAACRPASATHSSRLSAVCCSPRVLRTPGSHRPRGASPNVPRPTAGARQQSAALSCPVLSFQQRRAPGGPDTWSRGAWSGTERPRRAGSLCGCASPASALACRRCLPFLDRGSKRSSRWPGTTASKRNHRGSLINSNTQ